MQKQNPSYLRIIFFGTPELAAHVLDAIIHKKIEVVAAVTAPDKPAGRGRKLKQSPVKKLAQQQNIPVLQPENLKSPDFIEELKSYKPDLQVVVAFRMLPEAVWSLPPLGSFNLHASLLPDYRGAAPINWVIINGEKETGVTTFMLDHKIDTGKMLFWQKIAVDEYETAGSLHEKVKEKGASLVLKTIEAIGSGNVNPMPQEKWLHENSTLNKAPRIYKEDCRIKWDQPIEHIINHIHGLSPLPGAFTEISDKKAQQVMMKIFKARPDYESTRVMSGTILTDNKHYLKIAGRDGLVSVYELQMAGKKRMTVEELLRGMDFSPFTQAR